MFRNVRVSMLVVCLSVCANAQSQTPPNLFNALSWSAVFNQPVYNGSGTQVGVLKQAEVGVPVAELIRKIGVSEQTFYRWKKQYVGLESDQVREMKQLQDENSRLKQLVAELSLDKTMLQDVLRKKW